jgi:hypothetical protein
LPLIQRFDPDIPEPYPQGVGVGQDQGDRSSKGTGIENTIHLVHTSGKPGLIQGLSLSKDLEIGIHAIDGLLAIDCEPETVVGEGLDILQGAGPESGPVPPALDPKHAAGIFCWPTDCEFTLVHSLHQRCTVLPALYCSIGRGHKVWIGNQVLSMNRPR